MCSMDNDKKIGSIRKGAVRKRDKTISLKVTDKKRERKNLEVHW